MCPVSYVDVIPDYALYADLSPITYTHDQSSLYGQIFGSGYTCENSVDYCYEKLTFLMCPETCTGLADNDDLAYNEYASSDCHDTTSYDDDYLCIDRALEYDDLSVKCKLVLAYACPISFMDQLVGLGFGDENVLLNSGTALGPSDYLEDQDALLSATVSSLHTCSSTSYKDDDQAYDTFEALACPESSAVYWADDEMTFTNGVVIGPFPLDKGMMYDHEDVVMESLGMDCAAAFAGASVQRQELPFARSPPGNVSKPRPGHSS